MWNKDPLSKINEYRPSVRSAPITAAQPPEQAAVKTPAETSAQLPQKLDQAALGEALDKLAAHAQNLQRSLQFNVDKESGETVVKVIDSETHETIRQIPSEELLAIARHLRSPKGMLLTEQA